jgi:MFS family permease
MSAAHVAAQTAHKYYKRFLGLGWARVFLVLGVLLTLVAIANPLWSTTSDHGGGNYNTATYGWTTVTTVRYENGVWAETTIQSYTASAFSSSAIANALGGSYLAAVAYLVIAIVAVALFSLEWVRRLPNLGLLVIGLAVVVFALVALFYPLLTVPSAAAANLAPGSAIGGFWGSSPLGVGTFSWGAALGWWSLLIGVVLGIVGGIWPFLQALRNPMPRAPPPPPREWQVER